jgi:PadR family transcriptional regulator, regulatory protein AphA
VTPSHAASKTVQRLTTTSYAILGLLSVRSWSAYELTSQMKRGMRLTWPRAETRIYQEPKNLVAHGMARARTETNGRRSRTVYSITRKGQAALRRWLEEPSAPPQFECEALLRTTFADRGTKAGLLRTLRELREQVAAYHAELTPQVEDYQTTGGPFPDRLHIVALIGKFIVEHLAHLERWARWAEEQVETWPAVGPASRVAVADEVFDEFLVPLGTSTGQRRP